jgi:hypothetical protein
LPPKHLNHYPKLSLAELSATKLELEAALQNPWCTVGCSRNATRPISLANTLLSKIVSSIRQINSKKGQSKRVVDGSDKTCLYSYISHGALSFLMRKLSKAVHRKERDIDHESLQVAHADHCSQSITSVRNKGNSTDDGVLRFIDAYHCLGLILPGGGFS